MGRPLVEVFAVEDTSIQVCWRDAPTGPVTVRAGSVVHRVGGASGPAGHSGWGGAGVSGVGAAVIGGLPAATTMGVDVTFGDGSTVHAGPVTTLTPPPGRVLSRFATINDLHLGAPHFGVFWTIWNDDAADPAPLRGARAAIAEAVAWGADALVVKGDTTQHGRPGELDTAGGLLAASGLPIVLIEGNHETKLGSVDGTAIMRAHGIELATTRPTWLDLPGVRIIGVPTARWHHSNGRIEAPVIAETVELLAATPSGSGAVLALHHYPQRFRLPTLYPPGIPGAHARDALDAFATANPATLVIAGHSHRHRRHDYHRLLLAEAGSTKDFPGSWTGYTVYEGGIMQATRRIMDPKVMAWTERGRRVLGGVWSVWGPGLRSHRCFTHVWAPRP